MQAGEKATARQHRLVLRLGVLACLPIVAAWCGADEAQVVCCAALTAISSLLEVSLVLRFCPCRKIATKVPFFIRLCALILLDLQCSTWMAANSKELQEQGGLHVLHPGQALQQEQSDRVIPADPRMSQPIPTQISSISVVLPCANETHFVKRTVQSIFETTPREELKEIIIVDDASRPHVQELLGGAEEMQQWRVRLIRHDVAQGLIRSKKDGGDAALGDAIIFLDCHVKPAEGWTEPILANLRENPKRIVVPTISTLDPDTWTEVTRAGGTKMCLTWRADFFWCNGYPGHEVPIVSGGLVGMTSYWWRESGGYDSEMRAWGGENLDQSLRTWLCGGEIREAVGSRVAHMWRNPSKPETQLHYSIPTDEVRRNRLRATEAWLGPWAAKVRTFPEFDDFREGGPLHVGGLDSFSVYKKKLGCKSFDWYIEKFKHLYLDAGLIPTEIFHIKEETSDLCLQLMMQNGKPVQPALMPCSESNVYQIFHGSNANPSKDGACCSGIKAWDYDACMVVPTIIEGHLDQGSCQLFGRSMSQHAMVTDAGRLRGGPHDLCVVPEAVDHDKSKKHHNHLELGTCVAGKRGQEFERMDERDDGSFKLREKQIGTCLAPGPGRGGNPARMILKPCDEPDAESDLFWKLEESGLLKHTSRKQCVDAGDGVDPILYPCYPPGQNPKQVYRHLPDGLIEQPRSWADNGRLQYPAKCLDAMPEAPRGVLTVGCNNQKAVEAHWTKVWSEVPMEMQIYRKVAKQKGFLGRPPA